MSEIYRIVQQPNELTGGTYAVAETFDGHYIGDPETAKMLCDKRGIWPELRTPDSKVCCIGFCPTESKWYGWSHRAIYGFGVGSVVKKGDSAYTANNVDELYEDYVDFFSDVTAREEIEARLTKDYENNRVWVSERSIAAPVVSTPEGLVVALNHPEIMPDAEIKMGGYWLRTGRGAWTAKTLEDARQMACDFAESVS